MGDRKDREGADTRAHEKDSDILRCSFCNKSQKEVRKLIAGPTVFICDQCVDICVDIIAEDRLLLASNTVKSIQSLQASLDQHLEGQAAAKLAIATFFHIHHLRIILANQTKSNLFLAGPPGSGKSLAVKILAREIGLPFATIHAIRLTGIRPFRETNVLQTLYALSGGDSDSAGKGVICLEQMEKIAALEGTTDAGLRIQEALLQAFEGERVEIDLGRESIPLATADVLFVACGSFPGLDHPLRSEDLVRLGFLPEFAAWFPVCIELEALCERELAAILTKSGGLLEEYQRLFKAEDLELTFTPEAIQAIAREGVRRQGGARSLRSILESVALALAAEALATPGLNEYTVNDTFIRERIETATGRR